MQTLGVRLHTCTMHTLSAIMSRVVDAYTTCNGKYVEDQTTKAQRAVPLELASLHYSK